MPHRRSPLFLLLVLGVAPLWGGISAPFAPGVAWADAPDEARTRANLAFTRLDSPLRIEREAAVKDLVSMLPGVRAVVIETLPKASWTVQVHLLEVLAHDRSQEAVKALLGHLGRTDETQAVLIRAALLRDVGVSRRLLATFRRDRRAFLRDASAGPRVAQRLLDLVHLLRRDEIERLFLARKSRSGGTGYYRGQYESLHGVKWGPEYRRLALDVCLGIALDEAVQTPGVYRTGVYRFVRPHDLDELEVRGMATNAVSELCTLQDEDALKRLAQRLETLQETQLLRHRRLWDMLSRGIDIRSTEFEHRLDDWEDVLGEYGDLLACLYNIHPEAYDESVEDYLSSLRGYRYPIYPLRRNSYIAGLLIHVGWYKRAIDAYDDAMPPFGNGSKALGHYNQACAYASWSLRETEPPRRRLKYKALALIHLREAVEAGWSDIGWMNEDRDLDPIRDTPTYRELVAKIKRESLPPDTDER